MGGILILLLYTVPLEGFYLWKALGMVGLGVVVYTLFLKNRSNKPSDFRKTAVGAVAVGVPPPLFAAQEDSTATMTPPELSMITMPRAGFWIKLLAAALDVIVVAVLVNLVHIAALLVPLLAVYFVEMWTLKGKTIGGIICVLRLVRLDARPVDWWIATVCSLSRSFRYSWRGSCLSGSHLMMGDNLGTIRLPAPWWSVRQKVDR